MSGIKLFEGPSGRLLVPSDPSASDLVLKWDPATQLWVPGVAGASIDMENGTWLTKHAGNLVGLGSTEATVSATGSRDPASDHVCEIYLSDAGGSAKTLTLTDATGLAAGFTCTVFMQQASGAGRWSVATSAPSTLFTQPDANAWACDFVWNGSAWSTPTYKPIQDF